MISRFSSSGWLKPPDAAAMLRMTSVILFVYGCACDTRTCALAIREVAISSMARVIFIVDWTLLMRRRI